jgi:hypothetical protein
VLRSGGGARRIRRSRMDLFILIFQLEHTAVGLAYHFVKVDAVKYEALCISS